MLPVRKAVSFSTVAAGSATSLELDAGHKSLSYDNINIIYAGVTLAQMQNIEVVLDGKTIMQFADGTELDNINKYYVRGAAATNSVLSIHFARPELANLAGQRTTALGVADRRTLEVKMDIDAAAAAPVLTAYCTRSAIANTGQICKIKAFPRTFATAGEQEIDNLPISPDGIMAIHLNKSDVTNVDIEIDSYKAIQMTKTLAEDLQAKNGRLPITATFTHIDFLLDGDLNHSLMLAPIGDLRIRPTITANGAIRTIVEYVDHFRGI